MESKLNPVRESRLRIDVIRIVRVVALTALVVLLGAGPVLAKKGPDTPLDPRKPKCVKPPPLIAAWWPFDEASGPIAAEIVAGNDGTYQGSPTPSPGKVYRSLLFNGYNGSGGDDVEVPHDALLNFGLGDFSIDVWIKTSLSVGRQYIVDKTTCGILDVPYGYSLWVEDGYLGFSWGSDTGMSNPTSMGYTCALNNPSTCMFVADGAWHLVAVTVKRGFPAGGKLWVDGNLNVTFPTPALGSADHNDMLLIGIRARCRGPVPVEYFNGYMDELEIFHRELKQNDLVKIIKADCAGKCKPCEDQPNPLPQGAACVPGVDVCACGLLCCYPCGIPGCAFQCMPPDPKTGECPLFE